MRNLSRRAALASAFGVCTSVFAKDKKKRKEPQPVGLLAGTVFHSGGFSFPGVLVVVYEVDGKKPRWRGVTDGRGEYAIRVPATVEGIEYRVVAEAKGFTTLEHEVYAYESQRTGQNFLLKAQD